MVKNKFIINIFFLFGICMSIIGSYTLIYKIYFKYSQDSIEGIVIDIKKTIHEDQNLYYSIIKYNVKGKYYEGSDPLKSSEISYKKGERIKLVVDKNNPYKFIIDDFWGVWFKGLFVLIFGVGTTIISVLAYKYPSDDLF